jgi:glycosyltransferase involved in cell wall biosynthesis
VTGGPLISVVTPVYDTDPAVLRACLASVRAQTYERWQLCLVDDASPRDEPWSILREASASDPRIVARRREQNGGIVAASNDALELASGEVVVLLDHDDLLHPDALARVAEAFAADDELDYLYTDEDMVDQLVAGRTPSTSRTGRPSASATRCTRATSPRCDGRSSRRSAGSGTISRAPRTGTSCSG